MNIERAGAAMGATITDVDLRAPLSTRESDALADAFATYQVLSFPNQQLSPEHLLTFAGNFGVVSEYPFAANLAGYPGITEVVKREDDTINFGGVWHSDTTYTAHPPIASMLYSMQIPPFGGDTLFANMYGAWESLSDGLRQLLEPLWAVNTSALRSASGSDIRTKFKRSMAVENTGGPDLSATHPVARVHPVTGRTALYLNSAHTRQFDGMTEAESKPLLQYLFAHLRQQQFCYRHRWQPEMVTLWDNRCTQHYALNDYYGHRRVMRRVTIASH